MRPLLDRVLRTVRSYDLIPHGSRVVAAVSGGPDSVALLHLLHRLTGPGAFQLVGVAHLHHQLRGTSADEDERFCRALATEFSLPIHVEAVDVRTLAREQRASIEKTAREARLGFFERVASQIGADRVAVGHSRDDQAETFLLRLLRGAGSRGFAGIYPRHGVVIRPLLEVSRVDLLGFLRAHAIPFREDETNRNVDIPRNRVRHELIPYLKRHFSTGIPGVLAREATIAREDADWLEGAANEAARQIVSVHEHGVCIDVAALQGLAPAIARRVALQAMKRLAPDRFLGFDHAAAVLQLAAGDGPVRVALPGQCGARTGATVVLTPTARNPVREGGGPTFFRYSLSIPGEVQIAEAALTVSAERVPADIPVKSRLSSRGSSVVVEAADLAGPLTVRSRQPGDSFRPLGLHGRKKLQDFFVDRKIAREGRDRVPLVVDPQGRIVWIVGQAVAEDFRVTERTRSVILLKARHLGGLA